MNRSVLLLGAVVIAAMALYPPWYCGRGSYASRPAGYAPIFAPPHVAARPTTGIFSGAPDTDRCVAEISWSQLGVQCGAAAVLTLGLAFAKRS
jgi:hypothetical protein